MFSQRKKFVETTTTATTIKLKRQTQLAAITPTTTIATVQTNHWCALHSHACMRACLCVCVCKSINGSICNTCAERSPFNTLAPRLLLLPHPSLQAKWTSRAALARPMQHCNTGAYHSQLMCWYTNRALFIIHLSNYAPRRDGKCRFDARKNANYPGSSSRKTEKWQAGEGGGVCKSSWQNPHLNMIATIFATHTRKCLRVLVCVSLRACVCVN